MPPARPTCRSILLGLCALLSTATVVSGQGFFTNARQAGYVNLPGSDSTKGLWSYESGGTYYCLQTRGSAGMAILDMTDTSNPTLIRTVPGTYRKVQVYQNYAYATTDSGPTNIIDLTIPSGAAVVGTLSTGAHTLRVDDSNGRLYLNRSSSMSIYDLTADPTSPQFLGTWSQDAHDSRPDGNIVYVNGFQTNPTRILNVTNPANPTQIGSLPDGNHSSALYVSPTGQRALLTCDEATGGHLNIWDVDVPSSPVFLSSYQTSTQTSIHNVEVRGAYAYIAYYQDQLRILDLTDLSNPVQVAVWDDNRLNTGSVFSDAWEAIPHHDAVYVNRMNNTTAGTKGTHAIDFFPGFGDGSDGTGDLEPQIWWSFGPAEPGNNLFGIRIENARPNANAWLIIGLSDSSWEGGVLPAAMGGIGAPNATLYVSADALLGVQTDAQGNASLSLPIPASTPYSTYYVQWIVKDTGAPNPGGWAFSRAGKIIIQ